MTKAWKSAEKIFFPARHHNFVCAAVSQLILTGCILTHLEVMFSRIVLIGQKNMWAPEALWEVTLLCINVSRQRLGSTPFKRMERPPFLDCEGLVSTYQLWDVPDTERDLNEAPMASDANILAAVVIRVSQVDQHLCDE